MSANVPANTIAPPPESINGSWPDWFIPVVLWIGMIARAVGFVLRRTGSTSITLTANATSTTLTDDRIGPSSAIALTPTTSSATAIAPYISARATGSATISHGSSPAVDLTFLVLIG